MYSVIQFRECDGGTISVVCNQWLTPRKCDVYWPPVKGSKAFERLLHQGASPNEKWKVYGVQKILCETDNIDSAKKKLKLAEVTSDLQTEEDEQDTSKRPKRRCITTHYSSSEEEENDKFVHPPPLKQKYYTALQDKDRQLFEPSKITQESDKDTPSTSQTWPISSTPKGARETNNTRHSLSLSSDIFHNLEQEFMPDGQYTNLTGFQDKVVSLLTLLKTQNEQILAMLSQKLSEGQLESDFKLPIKTLEELEATENLINNKKYYDNLVSYLMTIGGRDVSSKVNRILKILLLDSLATEFNFYGQRSNKKPFCKLRLRDCVVEAVKKISVGVTDKDIEDCIKNWLKHASERQKPKRNTGNITSTDT